jgi:hypothetical protein
VPLLPYIVSLEGRSGTLLGTVRMLAFSLVEALIVLLVFFQSHAYFEILLQINPSCHVPNKTFYTVCCVQCMTRISAVLSAFT